MYFGLQSPAIMENKSKRDEVIEVVNKLFIHTDYQEWEKLLGEVFTETVLFDMSSLGGGQPTELRAAEIVRMWKDGFAGIDAVHHQAGNFLVSFKAEALEAAVFCYAIASHYKKAATRGTTRQFVGSYDLHVVLTDQGWRIDQFRYRVKYVEGNVDLT